MQMHVEANRSISLSLAVVANLTAVLLFGMTSETGAAEGPVALTVTTYNLRYASPTSPNSWPERRPVMKELIRQLDPDVMGTQEGVYEQLKDLHSDFPQYDWIGLGREGGSRGEFMAVFYRPDRLEPLEYDHYWLSDTPEVIGSSTWGNANRRMVTWIRFLDKQAGRQFYLANTHFDHEIQEAREKSAALVADRSKRFKPELPVLLIGDFNAGAGNNKVYEILVEHGPYKDAWNTADQRRGEGLNTFNGFHPGPHRGGRRIDWILYRGDLKVESIEINDFQRDGQYPSDHFPVTAVMQF